MDHYLQSQRGQSLQRCLEEPRKQNAFGGRVDTNLGQDHDSLFDATKIHQSGCRFILPHPNFMWKSEVSVAIEDLQVMSITITPRTSTLAGFTLSHHLTPKSA